MNQRSSLLKLLFLSCTLSLSWGCDSDDSSNGGSSEGAGRGSGVATAEWDAFCTATFTEDTEARDTFDDLLFTAKAGERYLIKRYNDFGGDLEAELYYLTNGAPIEFEIPADESGAFPFESNCTPDQTESHNTVFVDLTVYQNADLSDPLCELPKATHAAGISQNYLESDIFANPVVYRVALSGLASMCGDVDEGYVRGSKVSAFGSENVAAPLGLASVPAE